MATSVGHGAVVRRMAMAVATVVFVVGGPFASINDVANAAVRPERGVGLALAGHPFAGSRWLALAAAIVGAIVMTIGSVLVIFDVTGYYLAGLVSLSVPPSSGAGSCLPTRLPPYAGE